MVSNAAKPKIQKIPARVLNPILLLVLVASGCIPLPSDPATRSVGVGLAKDGRLQYFAPLCPGEEITSVEVLDLDTGQMLWAASQPVEKIRKGGRITVGKSSDFGRIETPLATPLPDALSLELSISNHGGHSGAGLDRRKVPKSIAGTDIILGFGSKEMPEEDFRSQVEDESC